MLLSRLQFYVSADSFIFLWGSAPGDVNLAYSIEPNPLLNDFSLLLLFLTIIIHFYSYVYFKKGPERVRFSILRVLFVFSMLLTINPTAFIFFFIAWEGAGLFSLLLVAFWHSKAPGFKSEVLFFCFTRSLIKLFAANSF